MGDVIGLKAGRSSDYAAFSDSMFRFRSAIESEGGRIVEIGVFEDWSYIDWLPAGADPELPPLRAEFTLPFSSEVSADLEDDQEEIRVLPDAEALFDGSTLTTCLVPGWAIPTPSDLLRSCAIAQSGHCSSCPALAAATANAEAGGGSLVAIVGTDRQVAVLISA